ncbi:Calmodulin-interacting protein 111 [Phytophthora citrophthora]|uniref:Calmodulin-interacting protein 111 n=1 Tax=Phytophthora citrophthora TaxID=4793 RepID=A0AAD9LQ97_9STRA|nr:Calmodulin-interacting protein 111 [Phytophthora citrophthora]
MPIDGAAKDVVGVHLTCRCRISPAVLRSRPRGSSQYVLCNVDGGAFAICHVALSSTDAKQHPVDATVTIRQDSRAFNELKSSLLAHTTPSNSEEAGRNHQLQWISRGAVRAAVAVTLELLLSSKSQLLCDPDTRSILQQTLQRNFVVCTGARVRLLSLDGLVAESKGELNEEDKDHVMTFRVVSTYPASPFARVTHGTRVTLTEPSGGGEAIEDERGDTVMTIPVSQPKAVKVGGMEDERAALRELILLPVAHPKLRSELGVEFPKGVLLCGPPGVGKTLLVRSVVHECRQVEDDYGATLDLKLQVINGSEIMTSGRGDAEQALRDTFEAAVTHARSARHAASVIFIDELDALCPKRESTGGGASSSHSRIVAQLLTLLDGVEGGISRENVVVAAATNLPNSIDPALRRPGRFDREIFVAPPNTALRKKIFNVHLNQTPYALSCGTPDEVKRQRDAFVDELAAKAVGYVGADIAALCREAVMVASTRHLVAMSRDQDLQQWWNDWKRRVEPLSAMQNATSTLGAVVAGRAWHANPAAIIPLWFIAKQTKDGARTSDQEYFSFLLGSEEKRSLTLVPPTEEKTQAFEVTMEDFDQAMQTVVPSALRGASGFTKHFERQGWDSIGGQGETKLALQQALEWPIKFPQTFSRLGVTPPRGVLLYGPPGCSKSSIVRAAAHSSGATFLSLSAAQVFSPFFGDAEAAVRQVFRDARAALPAIIFFDEIDVMVAKREFDGSGGGEGGTSTAMRVLSTMLNEMDGVESAEGLLVIGATNRPECIDAALMRPGRFDRILFVDLPGEPDRVDILRIHSSPMQLNDDVDLTALASRTPFFSGAELENLCREAALLALRESLDAEKVCMRHFDEALPGITPVSSKQSMRDYLEFAEAMGHLS